MHLWPHQQQGLNELNRAIIHGARNICLTCPTGGGKSRMMFERMVDHSLYRAPAQVPGFEANPHARTLYTDRRMLLDQLADGLQNLGVEYGIRAASKKKLHDDSAPIQLCMVQTQFAALKRGGLVHFSPEVYIDEAHKNGGDTAIALLDGHDKHNSVKIGFTATPLGIGHVYDTLVVAGTNRQLRDCGALVPAYTYGPDEPDTRWVGKVAVGEGECALPNARRMEYATRVFGRVVENYHVLNPDQKPALLFAPGVAESLWFAKELTRRGIPAAHIDGKNVWMDGYEETSSTELRDEIAERSKNGTIKVVCNRFVLREGINWPWIYHGIFATVFGSLTSYIQAGGRILRNDPSLPGKVIIQDHGGNWWRHGSLNADREWDLEYTDRIVAGMREQKIREKKEPEPIVCPKCSACRLSGPQCHDCGFRYNSKARNVLQKDGSLREMRGDIFKKRRTLTKSVNLEKEWVSRVRAVQKSKKKTVQRMTFAQLEVAFARDHNWAFPPRDLPMMPRNDMEWFVPVREVQELTQ